MVIIVTLEAGLCVKLSAQLVIKFVDEIKTLTDMAGLKRTMNSFVSG